jgi:hypothetical protein
MSKLQQTIVPRKKRSVFESSVMWVGSTYSLKFYEKQPEFEKHDMQKILKVDTHVASTLLANCKNVVRFEITLRRKGITSLIGIPELNLFDFVKTDMPIDKILEWLSWAEKAIGKSYMGESLVKTALVRKWGIKKGGKLFLFYSKYSTASGRREYTKILSRQSIYNYLKDIDEALLSLQQNPSEIINNLRTKKAKKSPEALISS